MFQRGITVGSDVQRTTDLVFTEFPKVVATDPTSDAKPGEFRIHRKCAFLMVVKLSATVSRVGRRAGSSGVDTANRHSATESASTA